MQQARKQGLSLRTIAKELGMARDTVGKYIKAESPLTKLLSAKERVRPMPWPQPRWLPINLGDIFAGQQQIDRSLMKRVAESLGRDGYCAALR